MLGELLIRDEHGNPLTHGEIGEIWFRGNTTFEYWKDPEKTASTRDLSDGSSTVGDIGWVDDDGFLYLTDRKSHMIVSGGVNIYPQEAENVLANHPSVADVAVVEDCDDDLGETVKAVVQVAEGIVPNDELAMELIKYCKEHLASFKCPRTVDSRDGRDFRPAAERIARRVLGWSWFADSVMSHTFFEEAHEIFRSSFRRFVESEVLPHHERWEQEGRVERRVVDTRHH